MFTVIIYTVKTLEVLLDTSDDDTQSSMYIENYFCASSSEKA